MTKPESQIQIALNRAWVWLKKQRKHYPSSDSIWSLRINWTAEYVFTPTAMMTTKAGTRVTVAHAMDACLFKAVALLLEVRLYGNHKKQAPPLNWRGMGGGKKALPMFPELA